MTTACNQETKYLDQLTPPSEQLYVALPGHPLYGCLVTVIRRRTTDTTTHCLVEDPDHPTFCHQILERWLSPEAPPPAPSRDFSQPVMALSLVALDRFVQLLLTQQSAQGDENDEGDTTQCSRSDLAPHSRNTKSRAQ